MQGDDPPFLPVGTDVSAKYKGAFCEAKIKKVVRNIKCKVTLKTGGGIITVNDDLIKGTLRVGSTVEVKQDPKKDPMEAIITKMQDCSQYTVVFDDGDITTLRRSALCLKSGRHFNESETLDQLPLTHPEHFSTPVIAGRRGRRGRAQSDESDTEVTTRGPPPKTESIEREPHVGRVVLVEMSSGGERRRPQQPTFPALVVAPTAQDAVKIKVKEDYLVRSFKDGRYYTVPKKEAREFRKGNASLEWGGVEAALQYLNNGVLPPHWDRDALFNEPHNTSDDSSDDEPREEKDHFVAQLYKFMDDRGTPLNRNPTIANRDIDLYRLFRVVQKLGGYNRVTNQNQWKAMAHKMGFHPVTNSITNLCKQAYKKFLHSFEDFYRKLGVTLVAHPRGARTPPAGRSLIRDRDKQHTTTTPTGQPSQQVIVFEPLNCEKRKPKIELSEPSQRSQRSKEREKESDKSETDKSEKEEKIEKIERPKDRPPRTSDGEDSADNQPLCITPKVEKEKSADEKSTPKPQKTKLIVPLKAESQDKRTPKPRRPLSSSSECGPSSAPRASRRPHVSTDSDSSGRASRCGVTKKLQGRRSQSANSASSGNTVTSVSAKRPRKRKSTEPSPGETSHVGGRTITAAVGDKLKVYYKTETKLVGCPLKGHDVTYEAKVIEVSEEGTLRVHYTGWNTRYDEWIKPQRIALNLTQHERFHAKKGNINTRRVRAKREEAAVATDSDTSDSEADVKRPPPKKLDDKSITRIKTPARLKEHKSDSSSEKIRKRPLRTVSSTSVVSPIKRPRSSITGRDYDLNEIRSELKGLHSVKQETDDATKTEIIEKDLQVPGPSEEPPKKQPEDVYEFKEPEPFEFELHDEKKKRTHRIFDDVSPNKYSSTLSKSLIDDITEDTLHTPVTLRSSSLSPFREYSAREDSGRSPEDDSRECLFSLDGDSLPGDSSSGPIFEGFTPAKNQETYSKKSKVSKLRELIDDSPDSPADDEQSSEDEPLEVLSKVEHDIPELILECISEDLPDKSPEPVKADMEEQIPEPKTIPLPIEIESATVIKLEPKEETAEETKKSDNISTGDSSIQPDVKKPESDTDEPKLEPPSSPLLDIEEDKSEPDSPARIDVLPEPPPGFLLHSEGPKIAEKLLKAINSAKKRLSTSSPPLDEAEEPKKDTPKSPQPEPPKPIPETTKTSSNDLIETNRKQEPTVVESIFSELLSSTETKLDTEVKKDKSVSVKESTSPRLQSPLNILERRKSIAELSLNVPGKSNKVLSDTIQKLSSQINQCAAIPLPTFPAEDRSDSSDSDDSDRRLIIDKLSVEEWGSGASSEASRSGGVVTGPIIRTSISTHVHAAKSPGEWSAGESLLMLEDACKNERKHGSNVVVPNTAKPAEEDSNISLLLCEETIPGSPAPDTEPAPPRHRLHMPFASAPMHTDAHSKGETADAGASVSGNNRPVDPVRDARRDDEVDIGWGPRDHVMDNTPPTTPDSSLDMSPTRERRVSDHDSPSERKDDDDDTQHNDNPSLDLDKSHGRRSRKVSESSGAGGSGVCAVGVGSRGRVRRSRRDTDDPSAMPAPPLKYNFYVELDPSWDCQSRINLLTSRLSDLRKAYHSVKAELAAIDRRRKKLRRKEREAVKAAKAACS